MIQCIRYYDSCAMVEHGYHAAWSSIPYKGNLYNGYMPYMPIPMDVEDNRPKFDDLTTFDENCRN